jgi:2-amino-4-hydroxy-6-hydroxymethyldihydropteridine diphosphokinase
MFPVIDLGPVAIQATGLILILSLWFGIWLTEIFSKNLGTNGEAIENGMLIGLLAGILGARVGFLMQNPSVFLDNPLSLVSLSPSMLNASFGLLVGGLTVLISLQKKHLPLWPTLDTLSPLIIFVFAGVHLANFANGNAYGLPTNLPWGIELWNANRHPVQIYVLVLTLGLLGWWLLQTKMLKSTGFLRSGNLFNLVTAALAFITVFTQAFVAEKTTLFGLDVTQVGAFLVMVGSLYLTFKRFCTPRKYIPVFLSIGANINPEENMPKAVEAIKSRFKLRRLSNLYWTKDIKSGGDAPHFINLVVEIETSLPYPDLVNQLKALEGEFGREPGNKQQVPLDLDVITYGSDVFIYQSKPIPDPSLVKYRYIVQPLLEIAPDFRHPGTGRSIQSILDAMDKEQQPVEKVSEVENGITG